MWSSAGEETLFTEVITDETEVLDSWDENTEPESTSNTVSSDSIEPQSEDASLILETDDTPIPEMDSPSMAELDAPPPNENVVQKEEPAAASEDPLHLEHNYPFSANSFTKGMSVCFVCGCWVSTARLSSHILNQHRKDSNRYKQYKCSYCEKQAIIKHIIEEHIRTYHPGKKIIIDFFQPEQDSENTECFSLGDNFEDSSKDAEMAQYKPTFTGLVSKNTMPLNSSVPPLSSCIKRIQSVPTNLRIKKSAANLSSDEILSLLQNRTPCPHCGSFISTRLLQKHLQNVHYGGAKCPIAKNAETPGTSEDVGSSEVVKSNLILTKVNSVKKIVDNNVTEETETVFDYTVVNDQHETEEDEEKKRKLDEKSRKICKEKISSKHKICGKCGFMYVKLRSHKLHCKGYIKYK